MLYLISHYTTVVDGFQPNNQTYWHGRILRMSLVLYDSRQMAHFSSSSLAIESVSFSLLIFCTDFFGFLYVFVGHFSTALRVLESNSAYSDMKLQLTSSV